MNSRGWLRNSRRPPSTPWGWAIMRSTGPARPCGLILDRPKTRAASARMLTWVDFFFFSRRVWCLFHNAFLFKYVLFRGLYLASAEDSGDECSYSPVDFFFFFCFQNVSLIFFLNALIFRILIQLCIFVTAKDLGVLLCI